MNKYQEALNEIRYRFTTIYGNENRDGSERKRRDMRLNTLQELVDKETPKKVKVIDEPDLGYIYYCPDCGATLMVNRNKHPKHLFNYCGKCSQKLDWSE